MVFEEFSQKNIEREFASLAFRRACEDLSDEKDLRVMQSGDTLTIKLNNTDILLVDWPKIKILSDKLATTHVLVRALYLLQIDAIGTQTTFGSVLKLYEGVLQCFPVLKGVIIDIEKRKAKYAGSIQTTKRIVDVLNELNEFFLKAAMKYDHRAVNALYACVLKDQVNWRDFPDRAELEDVLNAATTLAGKRLWFVVFEDSIVAKVTVQDFFREDTTYLLVSPKGISTPKISKKTSYAMTDLVRLFWEIRGRRARVKYSWNHTKSAELLQQFIEKAKTADVALKEQIIYELVKNLPNKAKASIVGVFM